ncbi:hypothetical protein [Halpernia sp.]|uniref:hypothetical protein n=1 Tax=Halpernia sp. TaxID=2782209 RepID=UPI003A939B33
MNTEQYHKLLQKFYDGETNKSEEELLKNSEHLSAEESLYFETLKVGKAEKSKLNFSEFIALAEDKKVIPISTKSSNFKWIWMAASLVLIFSLAAYLFINQENSTEKIKNQIATADIYKKEKVEIMQENTYEPVEVISKPELIKIANNQNILDDILPKKSRMKKRVIKRYVENSKPEKLKNKPEYESGYVIINGHKITNEKDAIDVTKYSFQILANNVNRSIDQTDVINTLNFDN